MSRRSARRLMNQINVVPYIDVTLVLLVIFMVTAPMTNPGVVELPQVGQALKQAVAPLVITVKTDKTLELDGKADNARRTALRGEAENLQPAAAGGGHRCRQKRAL